MTTVGQDGVKRRVLTPEEVLSTGLLWAINRTLLHPRGFALGYDAETRTLDLWGNGDEPWEYRGVEENEKFTAFEALLDSVRL